MPRIKQYTPQIDATAGIPGRQASAADFGGGGGLEALGGAAVRSGDILNDVAQRQEVSDVQTKLAQARADWTVHLRERAAASQPGDPNFASKFNEDFGNYISTLGNGLTTVAGRAAFEKGSAELAAHFVQAAGTFQAQSAGIKAKQDYLASLDANRNTLLTDPSQFDSVLKASTDALNDPSGLYARMPAADRLQLARETRSDYALSAVEGLIRQDPTLAKTQITEGKWSQYLDADRTNTLLNQADQAIRAQEIEQERARVAAERAVAKAQDKTMSAMLGKLFSDQGLSTKEVIDDPTLKFSQKSTMISLIERETKPDPISQVSHDTTMHLFADIHRPDGDPQKITDTTPIEDAYIRGDLSRTDYQFLRKEWEEARTPEGARLGARKSAFIKSVTPLIDKSNPLMGKLDRSGAQKVYEFSAYVDQQVTAYRQAGKNPYDLFDPSKPDYLGKPEILQSYQKTLKESLADTQNNMLRNLRTRTIQTRAANGAPVVKMPLIRQPANYTSPDDVVAAYRAGKLSRDDAAAILRKNGWAQ